MLPDFMIIGAMKAGTSSLFRYLASHPDIVPSSVKETDFFFSERNFERGRAWYESLFGGEGKYGLEASPNYTKRHLKAGMPERIHSLLPEVKMVFVVRDPIPRLISHYVHNLDHGREQRAFDAAIEDTESNYYQTSRYFFQLEPFLDFFPKDQIFIVQSERLRSDTEAMVGEVCSFFGISPECDPGVMAQQVHPSSAKTAPSAIERMLLKRVRHPKAREMIKRRTRSLRKPIGRPVPSEGAMAKLRGALEGDVARLREFTGQEFAGWSL